MFICSIQLMFVSLVLFSLLHRCRLFVPACVCTCECLRVLDVSSTLMDPVTLAFQNKGHIVTLVKLPFEMRMQIHNIVIACEEWRREWIQSLNCLARFVCVKFSHSISDCLFGWVENAICSNFCAISFALLYSHRQLDKLKWRGTFVLSFCLQYFVSFICMLFSATFSRLQSSILHQPQVNHMRLPLHFLLQ